MNDFMMVMVKADPQLDQDCLLLSADLAGHTSCGYNQTLKLGVGKSKRNLKASISTSRIDKRTLTMHPLLIKKSFLYENRQYGFKFKEDEIQIGPVVGIAAPRQNSKTRPFGSQTIFFQEIMARGRQLGQICFTFYFAGIDWHRKTINGYFHDKNGWQRGRFPIPDVIYPRSKFWVADKAESRRELNRLGVRILNPPMVGKWETYCLFKKNPELAPYLPETRRINRFRQVDFMLKKYRSVYLKPINGAQGKNIIRVSKNRKSPGYCYRYHSNGSLCKGSAAGLPHLQRQLRPVMGGRSYLVQEEINLLRNEGGIVDIRVMAQKNHKGEWEITGMACRIGKPGAITSNISNGGSGKKVETVLNQAFTSSKQVNQIMETIVCVCFHAAQSLEEYLGKCGEMGIDIGVDRFGKVWFIEANLRPARHVFSLTGEKQTRLKSVEAPLLYARYLAGF